MDRSPSLASCSAANRKKLIPACFGGQSSHAKRVQVFKSQPRCTPTLDCFSVSSHDGVTVEAETGRFSAEEIARPPPRTPPRSSAIDEAPVSSTTAIIDHSETVSQNRGVRVILAGTDVDFRGAPHSDRLPTPHVASPKVVDKFPGDLRCLRAARRRRKPAARERQNRRFWGLANDHGRRPGRRTRAPVPAFVTGFLGVMKIQTALL